MSRPEGPHPNEETWVAICGWESFYEVSDHGRVRSLPRPGIQGPNSGGFLHGSKKNGRHIAITLRDSVNGRYEVHYLHHLVARTFLPNPLGRPVVRHLDDDADDNSAQNLAWGTHSDNAYDRVRNGRHHSAGITHCKRGHEYTSENTGFNTTRGTRFCRTCNKAWQAAYRQKRTMRERGINV